MMDKKIHIYMEEILKLICIEVLLVSIVLAPFYAIYTIKSIPMIIHAGVILSLTVITVYSIFEIPLLLERVNSRKENIEIIQKF